MSITLRPLTMEDASFVYDLYQDPVVNRQAVLEDEVFTPQKMEEWVRHWLTDGKYLHFIVVNEQEEAVGLSQIFAIDRVDRTCEVGVLLLPVAQGNGYIGRIQEHQIKVARDVLGIREFKARIVSYNTHSLHVAQKMGFEQEAVRKRAVYREDEFHDILLFRKPVPQTPERV